MDLFDDEERNQLFCLVKSQNMDPVRIQIYPSVTSYLQLQKGKKTLQLHSVTQFLLLLLLLLLLLQYDSVFIDANTNIIVDKEASPFPFPNMEAITVTILDVVKLLQSLNQNKAIGPDTLSTMLLKEHTEQIVPNATSSFSVEPKLWINA